MEAGGSFSMAAGKRFGVKDFSVTPFEPERMDGRRDDAERGATDAMLKGRCILPQRGGEVEGAENGFVFVGLDEVVVDGGRRRVK